MPTLSGKKACWYPKICVYETWSIRMWCLCEVVGDWDVNKVVNYPIQNGDSGLRTMTQKRFPANPLQHCRKTLLVQPLLFKDGSFLGVCRKLCWRKAQVWACGYHDGFFYGEIRQCTCNWQWKLLLVWLTVSSVGYIHLRLIAGDTQQLALMWMEGHKPLLFPILYHILKFISVSLGADVSIMRQSSVNSLVCDGFGLLEFNVSLSQ